MKCNIFFKGKEESNMPLNDREMPENDLKMPENDLEMIEEMYCNCDQDEIEEELMTID